MPPFSRTASFALFCDCFDLRCYIFFFFFFERDIYVVKQSIKLSQYGVYHARKSFTMIQYSNTNGGQLNIPHWRISAFATPEHRLLGMTVVTDARLTSCSRGMSLAAPSVNA
jgi:hypothetical protein